LNLVCQSIERMNEASASHESISSGSPGRLSARSASARGDLPHVTNTDAPDDEERHIVDGIPGGVCVVVVVVRLGLVYI
jgi:hypothetical protein